MYTILNFHDRGNLGRCYDGGCSRHASGDLLCACPAKSACYFWCIWRSGRISNGHLYDSDVTGEWSAWMVSYAGNQLIPLLQALPDRAGYCLYYQHLILATAITFVINNCGGPVPVRLSITHVEIRTSEVKR